MKLITYDYHQCTWEIILNIDRLSCAPLPKEIDEEEDIFEDKLCINAVVQEKPFSDVDV